MSLKHIHYNCIRGWEFIPITAITGLFDVIACPTFVVLAWPLQDGLGIRTTLVVASVLGIGFWAASLTWRLVRHPADVYISGAFFFFIQIVYVHTCNVVVPLIASLRLAFRKRRKADATLGESGEAWVWSTAATNRNMQYGPDRDSFLRALQDSAEYEKIKRHAQSCFCEELVLFLHVFVALKQAIFAHFQEQHRTSAEHARSAATAAPGPPSSRESLPKSLSPWRPHTTMGFFGKYLDPGSSNRRSHSERTQRTSAERSRSMLRGANHDLSSRSTGIVDALQHAAPNAGFDGSTLVPEEHRHVLGAVIRTFILPDSVLAVNTSGSVLSACQKYLAGDQLVLGTLDKAKDEVLELLYSNVYQRL
ncbi:hypothetical protein GGF46_000136 [Coemansia sp. RSA 552]|nr:hypothetical protein GGF46_000136 [Coemansia sp. RSA 552]